VISTSTSSLASHLTRALPSKIIASPNDSLLPNWSFCIPPNTTVAQASYSQNVSGPATQSPHQYPAVPSSPYHGNNISLHPCLPPQRKHNHRHAPRNHRHHASVTHPRSFHRHRMRHPVNIRHWLPSIISSDAIGNFTTASRNTTAVKTYNPSAGRSPSVETDYSRLSKE